MNLVCDFLPFPALINYVKNRTAGKQYFFARDSKKAPLNHLSNDFLKDKGEVHLVKQYITISNRYRFSS